MHAKTILMLMCLGALAGCGGSSKNGEGQNITSIKFGSGSNYRQSSTMSVRMREQPQSQPQTDNNTPNPNPSPNPNPTPNPTPTLDPTPDPNPDPTPNPPPTPEPPKPTPTNGCEKATDESGQWKSLRCFEFKESTVPQDWEVKNIPNHLGGHLSYLRGNVEFVENDYVKITTRRHCVRQQGDSLTTTNATTGPCAANQVAQYASGRFESKPIVDASKPFRAEIRARINWNGSQGMRTALWMRNSENLQNCARNPAANDPYGELDIVEWYSSAREYAWSSSHALCYYSPQKNLGPPASLCTVWNTASTNKPPRSTALGMYGLLNLTARKYATSWTAS
ncbi:hypothetical protein [Eikenella longinqua]|uniref:hypothetical protein n=1 Tax=Eikenella longinqua TaxID=1795827 RepID=UPI000AEF3F0C|nr:hypothetical protein [Eikenella longinqua]